MPFSISSFLNSLSRGSSSGKELSDPIENLSKQNIYDFSDDWENVRMEKRSEDDFLNLRRCETPKFTYEKSKTPKTWNHNVSDETFNSLLPQTSKMSEAKIKNDQKGWREQVIPGTSRNVLSHSKMQNQKSWKEKITPEVQFGKSLFPEAKAQKPCLKPKSKYGRAQWRADNQSFNSPQNANTSWASNVEIHRNSSPPTKRRLSNLKSSSQLQREAPNGHENLPNGMMKYDFKTYREVGQNDFSDVDVKVKSPESIDDDQNIPSKLSLFQQKKPRHRKKLFTSGSEPESQPSELKRKLALIGLKVESPKSRRQTKRNVLSPKPRKSRIKKSKDDDKSYVLKRKIQNAEETFEGEQTDDISKSSKMSTSRRISTRAKRSINYYEEKSDAESAKKDTKDVKEDKSDEESTKKEVIKKKKIKEEKSGAELVKRVIKKKKTKDETEVIPCAEEKKIASKSIPVSVLNSTPITISSDLDGSLEDLCVSTEFKVAHKREEKKIQDEIFTISSEGEGNYRIEELQQQKPPRESMGLAFDERNPDVQANVDVEEFQLDEQQRESTDLALEEQRIPDIQGNLEIEELLREEQQRELMDLVQNEEGLPTIPVQPNKDEFLERICVAVEGLSAAMQYHIQIFEQFMQAYVKQNDTNH